MKAILLALILLTCTIAQGQTYTPWNGNLSSVIQVDSTLPTMQYITFHDPGTNWVRMSLPDSTIAYKGDLHKVMRYWFRYTDSLRREIDTLRKMAECSHRSYHVTAMGCADDVKCNTATCMICGKQWKTY